MCMLGFIFLSFCFLFFLTWVSISYIVLSNQKGSVRENKLFLICMQKNLKSSCCEHNRVTFPKGWARPCYKNQPWNRDCSLFSALVLNPKNVPSAWKTEESHLQETENEWLWAPWKDVLFYLAKLLLFSLEIMVLHICWLNAVMLRPWRERLWVPEEPSLTDRNTNCNAFQCFSKGAALSFQWKLSHMVISHEEPRVKANRL